MTLKTLLSLVASFTVVIARDITFPPVSGYQSPLGETTLGGVYNDVDVSSANFHGLTTYANLPYVHCLAAEEEEVEKYDIAILGAPFDTVSFDSLPFIIIRVVDAFYL